jgi:hypothetical protein
MAKVNLSRNLKSLCGKAGDLDFREMPAGSTVVSSAPNKKRRSTKAHREDFYRPEQVSQDGAA